MQENHKTIKEMMDLREKICIGITDAQEVVRKYFSGKELAVTLATLSFFLLYVLDQHTDKDDYPPNIKEALGDLLDHIREGLGFNSSEEFGNLLDSLANKEEV